MNVDKNSGQVITLAEAEMYTENFRNEHPNEIKAFFVGTEKLNLVLQQKGCIGIRIYNGASGEGGIANRVIVGVDSMGEDITDGIILEHLVPCPTYCSKSSPLTGAL
jgi:hypothetical protein